MFVETPVDLAPLSREIAHAADTETKTTGRRCRLGDPLAVYAFLVALFDGASLHAAAMAGGFSEGAVRRWMKDGQAATAPRLYRLLADAVAAIRVMRTAPAAPDPAESPAEVDPVALAARRAAARVEDERRAQFAAEAQARAVAAARDARIDALALRLFEVTDQFALVNQSPSMLTNLSQEADRLRAELDTLLRAAAPVTETQDQRRARYLRWRRLTRREGQSVGQYELVADRGFREPGFD